MCWKGINKGLYTHQEITEIHEAVLEIWRGGMLHQVRFAYVGKDGDEEVSEGHKMEYKGLESLLETPHLQFKTTLASYQSVVVEL